MKNRQKIKIFSTSFLFMAMVSMAGLSSATPTPRLLAEKQIAKPVRAFKAQAPWCAEQSAARGRHAAIKEPSTRFENLEGWDYLEGPDGSVWFYTSEYETYSIPVNEWYTETHITGYTFKIYDDEFNFVGEIKDKITPGANETKVAHAVLDPVVTTTFFNSDSKPEVMVYIAMNTDAAFNYEVHYLNKVYTIGGEKDEAGNDKSFLTLTGRCVDAFNAAEPGQPEDFYLSFVNDYEPPMDDFGFSQYIEWLNNFTTVIEIYNGTDSDGKLRKVLTKEIYKTRYPGDTTEGIYLITKSHAGQPHFLFSYYEKPYFIDPTGFATDESATPDNALIIENVTIGADGPQTLSTTRIPVVIKHYANQVDYTFYSIGAVGWKYDVDMTVNGTAQNPAYIVARDVTTAANLEDIVSSYEVYSNDGRLLKSLSSGAESLMMMASLDGMEPQALFIDRDENEAYTFNFVDLYSGTRVLTTPQITGDLHLSAAVQRVPKSAYDYSYVFELQKDMVDEEYNAIKRMLWMNRDGQIERIDHINMGQDVQYAQVNMIEGCISAYLFDTDHAVEYAVLVKRTSDDGVTTNNEFLVADDNGDLMARFSDEDGLGYPFVFTILNGKSSNSLLMIYRTEDNQYNADIYRLPFLNNGEGPTEDQTGAVDGIEAEDGSAVKYYNLQGIELTQPSAGQIVIRRSGTRTEKIIF